ncbi:hypothetical protein DFJ74DRAFT_706692 [Hyaloraphidium curvatum]|nr:hypothetical protein DFJ74DRAFT_706692 [Hyaloraphidium curvatum]
MDARAQAPFTTCAVCKDENLPSADPVYLCGAGGHAVCVQSVRSRHQKESCEAALVDCVNQGCQVPVARKDVAVHAVVCPKRIVSCTYPLCEHKGPADAQQEHEEAAGKEHLRLAMRKLLDVEERALRSNRGGCCQA